MHTSTKCRFGVLTKFYLLTYLLANLMRATSPAHLIYIFIIRYYSIKSSIVMLIGVYVVLSTLYCLMSVRWARFRQRFVLNVLYVWVSL